MIDETTIDLQTRSITLTSISEVDTLGEPGLDSQMPTLVEVAMDADDLSDASSTILHDESLLGAFNALESPQRRQPSNSGFGNRRSKELSQNSTGRQEDVKMDDSATILSRTLIGDDLSPVLCRDNDKNNFDGSAILSGMQTTRTHINSMPNMTIYQSTYKNYVQDTITKFAGRNPGRLRDYRLMSDDDKHKEQQNVMQLLSRLGIDKGCKPRRKRWGSGGQKSMNSCNDESFCQLPGYSNDVSISFAHSPPLSELKPTTKPDEEVEKHSSHKSEYGTLAQKRSMMYNSFLDDEEAQHRPGQKSPCLTNTSNFSDDSVEFVRAENVDSPMKNNMESPGRENSIPQKRSASTSGKRGADLARFKRSQGMSPEGFNNIDGSELEFSPYKQMDMLSIPSPSSDRGEIFAASQSPISTRLTYYDSDGDQNRSREISFSSELAVEEKKGGKSFHDSIYSIRTNNGVYGRGIREIPTNVALKNGATLFFNPLDTKRNERIFPTRNSSQTEHRQLVKFPDPFEAYGEREKLRLETCLKWIRRFHARLDEGETCSLSGALLSLTQQQIVDITLKLLLDDQDCESSNLSGSGQANGQTVIVVREKDNLEMWERALRENTACSVINHATLPSEDRKRKSTSKRCALYNVVLTTFDAIKAPDIATPVDDLGYAITNTNEYGSGWIASRTNSQSCSGPQKCKQFSVLHQISFKRVIFSDVLGRKSFLAKKNTARALASVALNGETR